MDCLLLLKYLWIFITASLGWLRRLGSSKSHEGEAHRMFRGEVQKWSRNESLDAGELVKPMSMMRLGLDKGLRDPGQGGTGGQLRWGRTKQKWFTFSKTDFFSYQCYQLVLLNSLWCILVEFYLVKYRHFIW